MDVHLFVAFLPKLFSYFRILCVFFALVVLLNAEHSFLSESVTASNVLEAGKDVQNLPGNRFGD